MPLIASFESMLRGLATVAYLVFFMIVLMIEVFSRPLYYPIFGGQIKKMTGREPFNVLSVWFSNCFLNIVGIKVEGIDISNAKDVEPCIVMFTHGSNLDAIALTKILPFLINFIAKKSLFKIPIFGYLIKQIGSIPIDRENLTSAISSLNYAAEEIREKKKNISISPEGTRRRKPSIEEPRITTFKKGPFHLARGVKVNILPTLIYGAHRLWPPGQIFPSSGTVIIETLPIVPKKQVEELSLDDLMKEVKERMEKRVRKIEDNVIFKNEEKGYGHFIVFFSLFVIFTTWVINKLLLKAF